MKFLSFTFFEKDKPDPSVLVSLAQAKRHETVEAEYAGRQSAEQRRQSDTYAGKGLSGKKDGSESELGRSTNPLHSPYTIEGLREEVTNDLATSGHDTAYDCEFCGGRREVWWLIVNSKIEGY
jgi:hypothetical protein